MQFFPRISFAETITNSSQAMPGPNVMFLIFPRGIWLRTVAPYEHPWQRHVVDVLGLPGDLLAAFLARYRCAHDLFMGAALLICDGLVHDAIIHIHANADTRFTSSINRVVETQLAASAATTNSERKRPLPAL